VAEKLARVNERLRPFEAELFVLDGYRPIDCQRGLWNFYFAKAKRQDASVSEQECRAYAMQFVVDPANFDAADSRTWHPHTTGAAADLTLRDSASKELLDMGANFEEIEAESIADFFERQLAEGRIDEDDVRLQNRRLLHWAMTQEGLLNETAQVFWHYDWGNQLYVRASRAFLPNPPQAAWYGYVEQPV
jgi:D-alanyl-D-alanine dipeptidase